MTASKWEWPELKHFDGITWAVFNRRDGDKRSARRAFVAEFGEAAFNLHIAKYERDGIMSIFRQPPDEYTHFYVCRMAVAADKRRGKEKSKGE